MFDHSLTNWRNARHFSMFMAAVMALAPAAFLRAQQPVGEVPQAPATAPAAANPSAQYLTPQTVAYLSLRPNQLLTSPNAEMFPIEVASAAGLQYLGLDPVDVDQVIAVVEPPLAGPPEYGVILKMNKPFTLQRIPEELRAHTVEAQAGTRPFLKSQNPMLPGFYMPDDQTLFIATQNMLKKQFATNKPQFSNAFSQRISARTAQDDAYLCVDLETLRPFIQMATAMGAREVPPEFQHFLKAPELASGAELSVSISGAAPSSLLLHANDSRDADQLAGMVDQAIDMGKAQMVAQSTEMTQNEDPIVQAMGRYGLRVSEKAYDSFRPQRDGDTFIIFQVDPNNESLATHQLTTVAVVGILVALLLPAVQAAREAARRNQSMNNLKQLMLSLFNYESVHKNFPAHASYSDDNKPLLSWRVHVLPYIEGGKALYDQFHLDEPWDSPHNKQLIPLMPAVFNSPNSSLDPTQGKSNYVVPTGEGLAFDGSATGMKIRQFTDGLSNTIAMLEVDDSVAPVWTQPQDIIYDSTDPTAGVMVRPGNVFSAAFSDGSVQAISLDIDLETLKGMFTRAGGEVINFR